MVEIRRAIDVLGLLIVDSFGAAMKLRLLLIVIISDDDDDDDDDDANEYFDYKDDSR